MENKNVQKLIAFIQKSPTAFQAIDTICGMAAYSRRQVLRDPQPQQHHRLYAARAAL